MRELKIGILQQHNVASRKVNMTRLAEGIVDLARRGAQLIVLQELHNSLYFCQTESVDNFELAEPIPGPSTNFFGEIAKQLGVVIVTSLFERRAPGLYHNTAVVIEKDGSIAGKYRKMHIPDDPAYYEKFYFTPGDLGAVLAYRCAGTSGIRKERVLWLLQGLRFSSTLLPSAMRVPTHQKSSSVSAWHGQPFSVVMRWQMDSL